MNPRRWAPPPRAAIGGRDYPVKGMIKNMWGTLTKSELHSWWKLQRTSIGYDTGEKYLTSVPSLVSAFEVGLGVSLSAVNDKTAGALAHRDKTEGKSSKFEAHGVGGDTGEQGAPPVGVLELRNMTTLRPGGKWADEERLRAYAHISYLAARKPG